MKSILVAAVAAFGLLAGASAAHAAPATGNGGMLYQGPGTNYASAGQLGSGEQVDASCDSSGWCQVTRLGKLGGQTGWIQSGFLTFGSGPQPSPSPQPAPQPWPQPVPPPAPWPQPQPVPPPAPWPKPQPWPQPQPVPPPVYEEAGACFYTERNFRGASFCLDEGDSYSSLPRDWNDRIRSVEVFGGARVDLCADNNLYGSCITLRRDTSRLPSGLDRRVSSLEVY